MNHKTYKHNGLYRKHMEERKERNPLARALINIGIKKKFPRIAYKDYIFTLASPTSRNPGYVYIKDINYNYLGKISPEGEVLLELQSTYMQNDLNTENIEKVKKEIEFLLTDKETMIEALKKEGIKTGICCCCGRVLTNKNSIAAGIGPICSSRL